MTALTTEQVIERAIAPGGALASIREEAEAQAAGERAEAEAAAKKRRRAVQTALKDAENEFICQRDRRWGLLLQVADVTVEYEKAEARLKVAQRVARSAGVKVAPCLDKLVEVITTGEAEDRRALHRVQTALASGL